MPLSLQDINIFAKGMKSSSISLCTLKIVLGPPSHLGFYTQITRQGSASLEIELEWDLHWAFESCMTWLCGEISPSALYSRGWALSARRTQKQFKDLMPESRGRKISKFLELIPDIQCSGVGPPLGGFDTVQTEKIEALVGSEMLLALEGLLQPRALAKHSQDQLIGLFILLFGETITVGHSHSNIIDLDVRSRAVINNVD